MSRQRPHIEVEETISSAELADARRRRAQFDRNTAWLQAHIPEVYARHRGECICIAGQELFSGRTAREAIAKARAAHPEDEGWFTRYIPKDRVPRIYAVQR